MIEPQKTDQSEQKEIGSGQVIDQATELTKNVQTEIEQFRDLMKIRIRDILNALSGQSFAGLAERQGIAKQVRELLDITGLRIKCPHCEQPATIRCYRNGKRGKSGSFQFEHLGGRPTRHGGLTHFPSDLQLVEKPPRKKGSGNRHSRSSH